MNIIIVGAGEIGRHLAESLSNRAHNIVVIETDEALVAGLNERLDARVVCDSGASAKTLAEVNAGECDLFLALTSDDETNLVSASLAKALGAKKTIARVHPSLQAEQWLFSYQAHFNIDHLFSSERLAAVELAKYVRNPNRLTVEEIGRGKIELQQIFISPHCQAVEQPIRDLKLPARVRVAFIQRHGANIVPGPDELLQVGDLVTLFGETDSLAETIRFLESEPEAVSEHNVIILGGGEYGFALAQMLEGSKNRVRIFERDKDRCEELTELLQRTVVLNVDATSLQELKEEQVGDADFFIAVTGQDEDNMMMCLQAKTLGVKYPVALVQRADYADIITSHKDQLGITGAVSPRVITSRELLRFVTSERFQVAMTLAGETEVLEFNIPKSSSLAGKLVKDLDGVEGMGLVALIRGNESFVPSGNDEIRAGDLVYAIVSPASRKATVKLLTS